MVYQRDTMPGEVSTKNAEGRASEHTDFHLCWTVVEFLPLQGQLAAYGTPHSRDREASAVPVWVLVITGQDLRFRILGFDI